MPKRKASPYKDSPSKKEKYDCKFNPSWTSTYNYIVRGSTDAFAYCKLCNSAFSITHGGMGDVHKHLIIKTHAKLLAGSASTPKVTTMFTPQKTPQDKVTKSEVLFAKFIAEHNLAFTVADHFTLLCKEMFPDSEVAQKFSCMRSKATHIVTEAMAPLQDDRITELCHTNKFSIMMDESNDNGDNKCVAILIRVLDRSARKIATRFLAMPVCNIGTGENLFNCLEKVFLERKIDWGQCIGYGSDNASVMVGRHNSVLSRIKEKQPNVYDLGCVCHIANTCAHYGLKKLAVPAEELLVDVYFHFQHSSKRKEEYKEFLEFTDTEPAKIIKHCATRWLSLEKCVGRILQQWPALKSYFSSHDDCEKTGTRVNRCCVHLQDPLYHLTYHFLDFIMGPLNEFNTTFQADESKIGHLHTDMVRLLRKFMGKFVQTKVITASSLTEVNYQNRENQHPDSILAVGLGARTFIHDNPDLPSETLKEFFSSVRDFYEEIVPKMIKKFPFEDHTLQILGFINPTLRQ